MNKNYNFSLNNFEGPLDLLLELVKTQKVDIFDIDLVELANAYLEVINNLKDTNLDLASEYLVMASTLISLKAKALLVSPEDKQIVAEEKENLLQKLVEHQQFKNLATVLKSKENDRKNIFIKKRSVVDDFQHQIDETQLDGSSDAIKLIINLRKMFERNYAQSMRETTIENFHVSPADRRLELIDLFQKKSVVTFADIFTVPSLNHFVVTVLTILDMSRKQEVILKQDDQFSEIFIKKGVIDGI